MLFQPDEEPSHRLGKKPHGTSSCPSTALRARGRSPSVASGHCGQGDTPVTVEKKHNGVAPNQMSAATNVDAQNLIDQMMTLDTTTQEHIDKLEKVTAELVKLTTKVSEDEDDCRSWDRSTSTTICPKLGA